jgi:hypothetical protein
MKRVYEAVDGVKEGRVGDQPCGFDAMPDMPENDQEYTSTPGLVDPR